MSLADNREPVATYDQALWWLIGQWCANGENGVDAGPLPPEAQIVMQIFWQNETQFRRDLAKRMREIALPVAPMRRIKGGRW